MVLILAGDPDTALRGTAATGLAASPDRSPAVADALWTLLDEDDPITRLEAAYGLALRDDPRTADAIDRLGPLNRFDPDHRANALWDWKRRRASTPAG
ncbi:HEAT repeat domain-containing protein [Streptomyces sp. NPDC002225]|uniref:HEAT repeat domain-containing protein n=1 Tax=Streptomyces sp. NPDC002225 TaxID=3154413 RepID=UPI003330A0FF